MNDAGEFEYAKSVIFEALHSFSKRTDLPTVPVQSFSTCTLINLDQFLDPTKDKSSSYCACLSISSDHPKQWKDYAEQEMGYAIGIDLKTFLNIQTSAVLEGRPYIVCAPVFYKREDQCNLVWQLLETGIQDILRFGETKSSKSEHITALRDRIQEKIITYLLVFIHFIKSSDYRSEMEMRLMLDPNNGTLKAENIHYFDRDDESIPYLPFDLRNPETGRLPLSEIKIGPKASLPEEKIFLDGILDELGYGNDCNDRPRIVHSSLAE